MWASIKHVYPDGGSTKFEVGGSSQAAYPDEAAELVARVLEMWRECVAPETEGS